MRTLDDQEQQRRLERNLLLAIQTVTACGHASRVTVADLLGDFGDLRGVPGSRTDRLCEQLEDALKDDIQQNLRVAEILGLRVPSVLRSDNGGHSRRPTSVAEERRTSAGE